MISIIIVTPQSHTLHLYMYTYIAHNIYILLLLSGGSTILMGGLPVAPGEASDGELKD